MKFRYKHVINSNLHVTLWAENRYCSEDSLIAVCAKTAKEFQLIQEKKAIQDSVKTLGYEQIRKGHLDVVTNFIGNYVFISLSTGEDELAFCLFTVGIRQPTWSQ